jgi:PAS domain S-box-containing protein
MRENRQNKKLDKSLSSLLNLIPDSVVVLDSMGYIVAVNQSAEKNIGIKTRQAVGKKFIEQSFMDGPQKKVLVENLKKRLNGDPLSPYKIEVKGRDGTIKTMELTRKKIQYETKILDLVIMHNLTEKTQHHTALSNDLQAN